MITGGMEGSASLILGLVRPARRRPDRYLRITFSIAVKTPGKRGSSSPTIWATPTEGERVREMILGMTRAVRKKQDPRTIQGNARKMPGGQMWRKSRFRRILSSLSISPERNLINTGSNWAEEKRLPDGGTARVERGGRGRWEKARISLDTGLRGLLKPSSLRRAPRTRSAKFPRGLPLPVDASFLSLA